MSRNIDLYSYDYIKLKEMLLDYCETDRVELIDKILNKFGSIIGNKYIILNNEYTEEYNCHWNITRVFDKIFNTEDIFDDVFDKCDKQDMIIAESVESVIEEIYSKIILSNKEILTNVFKIK